MAEQIDLNTPVPGPTLTGYRVLRLGLYRGLTGFDAVIRIELIANNGDRFTHVYEGQTAFNLIFQLNVANLSVKSLERRILEKLVADGVLLGTVNGAPNPTPDPTPW